MSFADCTDKELDAWHIFFMRIFDKIQAGHVSCSGISIELIERALKAIIRETNARADAAGRAL